MNFKVFSVGTTNIFPIANSKAGGQLLTEYNLRCRESVNTDPDIKYMIGPSYVHSMDDYYVDAQKDENNGITSSTILEISPGRAVINGHFIESLTPISIDIALKNSNLLPGETPLKGELSVGLRVMYSTDGTMSGSMLVESDDTSIYEGIQVVILPKDEFIVPGSTEASKTDEYSITAHIKLADFTYLNGAIRNIRQNQEKIQNVSADRIKDVNTLFTDQYVSKTGLNTKEHHYIFSSKHISDKIEDTWCNADDSLMVWDSDSISKRYYVEKYPDTDPKQACFVRNGSKIELVIPHKQIDGAVNSNGEKLYMPPNSLPIPAADYTLNTSGIVDDNYTQHIKSIETQLSTIRQTYSGKQVHYIDTLESRSDLPSIGSSWSAGDYVFVQDDLTVKDDTTSAVTVSTMYMVLPGQVLSVSRPTGPYDKISAVTYTGVELAYIQSNDAPNTNDANEDGVLDSESDPRDGFKHMWNLTPDSLYRGRAYVDYFTYIHIVDNSKKYYFYPVATTNAFTYSDPIYVTGEMTLAETDKIGGFYNVTESDRDNGYIWLDETGHLRLLDYALLRSGTLAYQLGSNWDSGSGLTIESIQEVLEDEVNRRVAFANTQHETWVSNNIDSGATTDVIHLYIRLSEQDTTDSQSLFIRGIDSRFNTSVYLHVDGNINVPLEIYILNCEKIRIDNSIPTNVHFTVADSCLYYDAVVIDNITAENITLWYKQYQSSEPSLVVDGMTVSSVNDVTTSTTVSGDNVNSNDSHYSYRLKSITFGHDASITGLSILINDASTNNIQETGSRILVDDFKLNQSNELTYPVTKLTNNLSISGSFVTAYPTEIPESSQNLTTGFIVSTNHVTVVTDKYEENTSSLYISGTISIYTKSEFVNIDNISGLKVVDDFIDGLKSADSHVISGGVLS